MRQSLSHNQWWSGVRVALARPTNTAGPLDGGAEGRARESGAAGCSWCARCNPVHGTGRECKDDAAPLSQCAHTGGGRARAATSSGSARGTEASGRMRRSSTSDEEDSLPIMEAWRARQQQKRTRSLTSSARTAAAVEDGRSEHAMLESQRAAWIAATQGDGDVCTTANAGSATCISAENGRGAAAVGDGDVCANANAQNDSATCISAENGSGAAAAVSNGGVAAARVRWHWRRERSA